RKPQSFPNVVSQAGDEEDRDVEKIAVKILHDERERALPQIGFARLAYGARRWIGPEGLVVSAAIVVAGDAEQPRRPENQVCRRIGPPCRPPDWFWAKPGVWRVAEKFRRIERREVRSPEIIPALESR